MIEKIINIKVLPRASRNQLEKISDTHWRVKLTTAPIGNKANLALIKFLSKELNLKKSQIEIVKGEKSRDKLIKIT